MAYPANCTVTPVESTNLSNTSRSTSSSRMKSFSSLESRKPRDSVEKMRREREKSLAHTPPPVQNRFLKSIRNLSIQVIPTTVREDREDELEEESTLLTLPVTYHPPIHRGVVCERCPKGKGTYLVFLLNLIVSYAFGAAVTGILDILHYERYEHLSPSEVDLFYFFHLLFQFCASRFFYPIAGFIADVYTGRCRMILISLILLTTGYLLLVIAFTLGGQSSLNVANTVSIIRGVSFVFISAGGGAFEATIIPFGVDQLQGASSAEISSYFYIFYFTRNLGMGFSIIIYNVVFYATTVINSNQMNDYFSIKNDSHINELYSVFQPLVTINILTIGIVLYICFNHWFFKNTLWENPVKLVAKILCYAATVKRHLPVHRRAFRYGEGKKSRIDLAKVQYDGKYSAEKVEDVKTFCRILFLILTLIPTMFSLVTFNIMTAYEITQTMRRIYPNKYLETELYPNIFFGLNGIFVLSVLPIVNFILIPYAPKLTIRARIGIGLVLYLIGNIATVAIHSVDLVNNANGDIPVTELSCLLLPIAIFAVAEVLTIVSVLEFIYAQSPESMKGLLTGLFFFILGLSSIASSTYFFKYSSLLDNQRLAPFFTATTAIQFVGVVFYGIVATIHKNRLRPDGDSFSRQQQLIIEDQLSRNS